MGMSVQELKHAMNRLQKILLAILVVVWLRLNRCILIHLSNDVLSQNPLNIASAGTPYKTARSGYSRHGLRYNRPA